MVGLGRVIARGLDRMEGREEGARCCLASVGFCPSLPPAQSNVCNPEPRPQATPTQIPPLQHLEALHHE